MNEQLKKNLKNAKTQKSYPFPWESEMIKCAPQRCEKMTTYPHELTECEECGAHYCMGCAGEECPNCKLKEVAFYAIELEHKLEALEVLMSKWKEEVKEYPDTVKGLHAKVAVDLCRKEVEEILEAEDDDS